MIISRESIFRISYVGSLPFHVIFEPGSESDLLYGRELLLEGIYNDKESEELILNYYNVPSSHTHGKVKAKETLNNRLTNYQKVMLSTIGFDTEDVFEISHR